MSCTFRFGALTQSAECGGMTAFDANVNQHAANTSPRNLSVQLCMQKTPYQPVANLWRTPPINNQAPLSSIPCTFENSWVSHWSVLEMPFSGKLQTETKLIPMKLQPQKPNTKPICILPRKYQYLTKFYIDRIQYTDKISRKYPEI